MTVADDDALVAAYRAITGRLGAGVQAAAALGEARAGTTARTQLHGEGPVALYRYQPPSPVQSPLLIVYAMVNRPYMIDLQPQRSLVRGLLGRGLDVYLVDWGTPGEDERRLTLADYLDGSLDRCVEVVRACSGRERINLLGICQGGTFALCYTALHGDKIANLITTVTPVDFQTPDDLLSHLVRHVDVDRLVDHLGNVPGELLNAVFLSLKPFRLGAQKYVHLLDRLGDPSALGDFLRMERWIFDSPAQPAEVFRQFVKDFYQANALVGRGVRIGHRQAALDAITVPVLNIYARDDHLVPPAASRALQGRIGARDYAELEVPGGHIGIYVGARAQALLPAAIGDWIAARGAAGRT